MAQRAFLCGTVQQVRSAMIANVMIHMVQSADRVVTCGDGFCARDKSRDEDPSGWD